MTYRTPYGHIIHEIATKAEQASRPPMIRSSTVLGWFVVLAAVVLVAVPLARLVRGF